MSHFVTPGQSAVLRKLCGSGEMGIYVISQLIGRKITDRMKVRRDEWQRIRDEAYPGWTDDDWTVSPTFSRKIVGLANQYLESQGQLRLF